MQGDIFVAGFVITEAEWDALDEPSRAQLLAVASRRDGPWVAAAPPPRRSSRSPRATTSSDEVDVYDAYELVLGAA
ncbi:MAG: hypothetical protein H6708_23650 [Kofleriaceae bacterium]|nr:hypothetical protein [Kofleriaceae bacterium]